MYANDAQALPKSKSLTRDKQRESDDDLDGEEGKERKPFGNFHPEINNWPNRKSKVYSW